MCIQAAESLCNIIYGKVDLLDSVIYLKIVIVWSRDTANAEIFCNITL